MLTNLLNTTIQHYGPGQGSYEKARRAAANLFDRAYERGRIGQVITKLFGQSNTLRTLPHQPVSSGRAVRTLVVPLADIVGSEGRCEDFDSKFHPLKQHLRERWIGIAAARRCGITLPAVELVRDGQVYYVRDGHHRISVAKMLGQVEIDARIVN